MNPLPVPLRLLVIAPSLLAIPLMAQTGDQTPKVSPPPPAAPVAPTTVAAPATVASAGEAKKASVLTTPPSAPVSKTEQAPSYRVSSRYLLGPGDELNFALYGKPTLARANVAVSPDGTICFLQAKQVPAAGRTIDQLRDQLKDLLSAYHRDPLVVVTPAKLRNQSFTILGEVVRNGSYPLNRPTTLVEALAQAGGFTVGSLGNDASELADLRRSFVIRDGRRLCVDMESLYLRGDFSQNILLEPGDYIHIASLVRNEIFVLGRVERPGVYPIRNGMTAMGAVAAAGGFSKVAWRNRVLVVRGKLNQPECHVLELNKTMHGRAPDMDIQPGDLVFVSLRPWAYPAEVLDAALLAYVDGTIAGLLTESGDIGYSVGRVSGQVQ